MAPHKKKRVHVCVLFVLFCVMACWLCLPVRVCVCLGVCLCVLVVVRWFVALLCYVLVWVVLVCWLLVWLDG